MPNIKRPRHKPSYRLEELDGEILLAHPAMTKTIYLNETAALIWQLCNGQRTTAEIAELLQEAFPDADGTIAEEVDVTLRRLLELEVIEFA